MNSPPPHFKQEQQGWNTKQEGPPQGPPQGPIPPSNSISMLSSSAPPPNTVAPPPLPSQIPSIPAASPKSLVQHREFLRLSMKIQNPEEEFTSNDFVDFTRQKMFLLNSEYVDSKFTSAIYDGYTDFVEETINLIRDQISSLDGDCVLPLESDFWPKWKSEISPEKRKEAKELLRSGSLNLSGAYSLFPSSSLTFPSSAKLERSGSLSLSSSDGGFGSSGLASSGQGVTRTGSGGMVGGVVRGGMGGAPVGRGGGVPSGSGPGAPQSVGGNVMGGSGMRGSGHLSLSSSGNLNLSTSDGTLSHSGGPPSGGPPPPSGHLSLQGSSGGPGGGPGNSGGAPVNQTPRHLLPTPASPYLASSQSSNHTSSHHPPSHGHVPPQRSLSLPSAPAPGAPHPHSHPPHPSASYPHPSHSHAHSSHSHSHSHSHSNPEQDSHHHLSLPLGQTLSEFLSLPLSQHSFLSGDQIVTPDLVQNRGLFLVTPLVGGFSFCGLVLVFRFRFFWDKKASPP
mmetsp:Transcript_16976/g.23535  ORF Transcript_16976/g.23535 Transcript_16976/m.23535 type:complete len:507 (+) Transcript_16976:130-1650(+)